MHDEDDNSKSAEKREELLQRLDAIGLSLAKTRSEAIDGRDLSGIENEWMEDEEYYEGIDDANRKESSTWHTKPVGQAGLRDASGPGSTVFVNITRPYCDAASARVSDMLLPTDDRAWAIQPTPVSDLVPVAQGEMPPSMERKVDEAFQGDEEGAAQEKEKLAGAAKDMMRQAQEIADKAEKRIEDWHVECQYHAHMRQVIEDCSRIGSGVLKGPVPEKRRNIAYKEGALIIQEEIKPASRRIDPWNLYPDPGCGENIHNGGYIWERDDITFRQLEALIGVPGYIPHQIMKVIREGPSKAVKVSPERADELPGGLRRDSKNLYEIWYYYGRLKKDDLEAMNCECKDDSESVPVQVTMVNNRVIKAALNPLDSGDFPYDVMVWQRRQGLPWGMGVSRQIRTPQRIVNAAARNMMDNAGFAGGPQLVVKPGIVEPADGIYEMRALKMWMASEDADLDHLDNAFRFVTAPMLQGELQAIIQLGMKLAEDVTGLPMIMQGQMGQTAPDTLGGMQMLSNNASAVMRRIARLFDDLITEPHIRRYYNFLLMYGEDDEKGDFQIDARGSSALVERDAQAQLLMGMMQIVLNPMFGFDPKKWANEFAKSQRFDPKKLEFDDDEWQQIVSNMSQPQDSSLQVAQMKVQADQEKLQLGMQMQQAEQQFDAQMKQAEQAFEAQQNERDRELKLMLEQMSQDVERMRHSGNRMISMDKIKAMLADSTMKLETQKQLAGQKQIMQAPVEPPGRAERGRGFSQ